MLGYRQVLHFSIGQVGEQFRIQRPGMEGASERFSRGKTL